MVAKVVSKPIRKSFVSLIAGFASFAGLGQAMYLKATYQSPPDARGPRSGHEASLSVGSAPTTNVNINTNDNNTINPAVTAILGEEEKNEEEEEVVESSIFKTTIKTTANSAQVDEEIGIPKQILIIGDSLVSGVGGLSSFADGPSDGPALPRQVARSLSEKICTDVIWKAMSLTGGDVRLLRRKIIPMLKRERNRGTLGEISAIVLVTGVNDWKRFSPFRTASKFHDDLQLFINDLQREVGNDDCLIFVPAIPGVRHTPRFHEPLRSIVVFLNDLWDGQKLLLARSMKNVFFVGQPANTEWGDDPLVYFSTLDRVHPSELGYRAWADRIAIVMKDAMERTKANVGKVVASVQQQTQNTKIMNTIQDLVDGGVKK